MIPFLREILDQPRAVRDTAEHLRSAEFPRAGGYGRIVATGMGSSYFVGSAFALLLEGRGVPAFCINAGELLHYGKDVLKQDTLLVAISQSGESYETVKLVGDLNLPRERVIAITNEPSSRLAALAGSVVLTRAGEEKMTSTKTFITSWMAALALADAITASKTCFDGLDTAVADTLKISVEKPADLVGEADSLQFTARGIDFQVAQQSALMCMEALHISSSALTGGDFRHGPLEMIGPGKTVVVISHSQSPTHPQSLRLVDDILRFGGNAILVSDPAESRATLAVAPTLPEFFPIVAVLPLQLLIVELASRRGIVPGDFSHGGKITSIE